jgi:hypothetical protein
VTQSAPVQASPKCNGLDSTFDRRACCPKLEHQSEAGVPNFQFARDPAGIRRQPIWVVSYRLLTSKTLDNNCV